MKHTTSVPNIIFDQQLPHLTKAELKILMVIIRQTLGWIDSITKQRKAKDWISHSFFTKRTKLTTKSISLAIQSLIQKDLILALTKNNTILATACERRGKKRIYYAYKPYFQSIQLQTKVHTSIKQCTYLPYTKETQTKKKHLNQKLSDQERLLEILQQQLKLKK